MIITELQHDTPFPQCFEGPQNEAGTPRTYDRLHLSTIYRDLDEAWRQTVRDSIDEDTNYYLTMGWMWEWALSRAFADAYAVGDLSRTEEWERDGIVGSPDSMRMDPYRVVEFKATYRSERKLESMEKWFWTWLVQAKSYCWMTGAREWELHALFVNGNWRPPQPNVRSLLIQFSDAECEENWEMIVNHARRKGWL